MLEKAVADQTHHILPVVVALVGDFLLQHGTDGDHRRKGISKKEKLQKEAAAQDAECGGYDNGDDSENFENWRGKLKQPQGNAKNPILPYRGRNNIVRVDNITSSKPFCQRARWRPSDFKSDGTSV